MNLIENKGILISIVLIALILVFGAGTYLYLNDEEKLNLPDKSEIEKTATDYLYSSKKLENDSVKLTHVNSNYARVEIETEFGLQNLFLKFENGLWKVASLQGNPPFCEILQNLNFPSNFFSDCLMEFPNAKKVSDLNKDLENKKENEIIKAQIIGELIIPDDPSCNNCFSVTDGEEIIEINYDITKLDPSDFNDVSVGDTIIVDTEISNDEENQINITANKIQEINNSIDEEDQEPEEEKNQGSDLSEVIYYDITDLPPDVAPPDAEFFELLFDRDFSNQDFRIIGDF